jgi:tetratricopeptide (TPR) repeat protein
MTFRFLKAGGCIAALLMAFSATAQQGAIDARTFEQLTKAQTLAEEKRHEEAIQVLDALKGNPRLNSYARSQLWNFYAFIYASQEQYQKAIDAYRQVLAEEDATDGLKLTAKYTIAQLYFQLEQYAETIRFMQEWLREIDKPTPTAHIMLAQAYYQTNDFRNALRNVERAIRLREAEGASVDESWLRLKAALHYNEKDYAAAAQTYEQLIGLSPKLSYLRQLAGMYSELGQDSKRLAVYDAVHEYGGLNSESEILNLAYMWLGQSIPYKAGRVLESAMQKGQVAETPKNIETLANAWAQANEHKKAIPALERAASLSGQGVLYARLAGVHFNAGDYAKAVEAARRADDLGGLKNRTGNLMLLGMAHFNAQEYSDALQAFRRAKQDRSTVVAASRWETYTLAEIERLRALEAGKLELQKRTEDALEAQENNLGILSGPSS